MRSKRRTVKRILAMTEGTDYTVSWTNNTAVKTDLSTGKNPTLTIKGKGNFAGSTVRCFKIGKKPFNDPGLTVIVSDVPRSAVYGRPGFVFIWLLWYVLYIKVCRKRAGTRIGYD